MAGTFATVTHKLSTSVTTFVRGESASLFEAQSVWVSLCHIYVQTAGEDMREMLLASKLERCGLLKCGEFPKHRKDAQIYQVVKKT